MIHSYHNSAMFAFINNEFNKSERSLSFTPFLVAGLYLYLFNIYFCYGEVAEDIPHHILHF